MTFLVDILVHGTHVQAAIPGQRPMKGTEKESSSEACSSSSCMLTVQAQAQVGQRALQALATMICWRLPWWLSHHKLVNQITRAQTTHMYPKKSNQRCAMQSHTPHLAAPHKTMCTGSSTFLSLSWVALLRRIWHLWSDNYVSSLQKFLPLSKTYAGATCSCSAQFIRRADPLRLTAREEVLTVSEYEVCNKNGIQSSGEMQILDSYIICTVFNIFRTFPPRLEQIACNVCGYGPWHQRIMQKFQVLRQHKCHLIGRLTRKVRCLVHLKYWQIGVCMSNLLSLALVSDDMLDLEKIHWISTSAAR